MYTDAFRDWDIEFLSIRKSDFYGVPIRITVVDDIPNVHENAKYNAYFKPYSYQLADADLLSDYKRDKNGLIIDVSYGDSVSNSDDFALIVCNADTKRHNHRYINVKCNADAELDTDAKPFASNDADPNAVAKCNIHYQPHLLAQRYTQCFGLGYSKPVWQQQPEPISFPDHNVNPNKHCKSLEYSFADTDT